MFKYYLHLNKMLIPVFLLLVLSVFYSLLALSFPWINKVVYDNLLATFDIILLRTILFSLICVVVLSIITNVLTELVAMYIETKLTMKIREETLDKILNYRYAFFTKNETGDVIEKIIPEIETISSTIVLMLKGCSNVIKIFLILVLVSFVNAWLALSFVIMGCVYLGWHIVFKIHLKNAIFNVQSIIGDLYTFFYEHFSSIKHIKIFMLEDEIIEILNKNLFVFKKAGVINSLFDFILRLSSNLSTIASILILTYAFFQIKANNMSVGEYLLFVATLSLFLYPINELVNLGSIRQRGLAAIMRLESIYENSSENFNGIEFRGIRNGIKFENVSLSLGGNSIIKKLNIEINKGESVAFVGASGSGKTSVANLLSGIYRPTEGSIKLDDNNLDVYDVESLREKICFLSQDIFLFNESIRNTVDFNRKFSDSFIQQMLANVGLENVADDLDKKVGENGAKLSGGERQRIAFTRAFSKNIDVLILDEVTSQVDKKSEKMILNATKLLQEENKDMITIIITHRLSNLESIDKIIMMDNGEMIEQGSVEMIMSKGSRFNELFNVKEHEVTK